MKLENQRRKLQASIPTQSQIEVKFKKLAEQWKHWKSKVWFLPFTQKLTHPAYQQIIALGHDAIPLLLKELAQNDEPDHWFYALIAITGENPIAEEQRGRIIEMKEAWIKWGKTKGYIN
ncbi:MAG: hypothetical protein F6K54_12860 [Okeania sp. SIO3B5]|nr:hypothetical protein [Okeania sp. SIO3B5]